MSWRSITSSRRVVCRHHWRAMTVMARASGRRGASFLHGTIAPVALMVMEELSRLFEQEITLNFDRLFASDIMGRARAFGSLRTGGMAGDAAAEQTGFAWKEDENVVAMPTEDDEEDDEDEDGEDENGDGSDDGEEEDEAAA